MGKQGEYWSLVDAYVRMHCHVAIAAIGRRLL